MLRFSINNWSAWAPTLQSTEDWRLWAKGEKTLNASIETPQVKFVAPLLRRRLSHLSKMALAVCEDCLKDQSRNIPIIFTSRHGELNRTLSIVEAMLRKQPLSPTDFSLCVHNTPPSLYTIVANSDSSATALAASDSFTYAFVESVGYLLDNPQVLFIYADDSVPELYHDVVDFHYPIALAFLLTHPARQTYSLSVNNSDENAKNRAILHPALAFMKFYIMKQNALRLSDGRLNWMYRYHEKEKGI
jgi:hypothetical protein